MDVSRSIPLATALLLLCAGTSGQTPAQRTLELHDALVEEVRAQLSSDDPKTIAWGAHRAAEHRLAGAKHRLRDALGALAKREVDPMHYAVTTVLDALVQLDADVPVSELEPFFGLAPAVVLLLGRERDIETLLRVFRAQVPGSSAWRACGNALVTRSSPEFVAAVLRATIVPWVRVRDGEPGETFDLPPPDTVGCSLDFNHGGWPLFPRYEFSHGADARGVLLTAAPFLTAWDRTLRPDASKCTWSGERTLPEARASWLLHLLGKEHEQAVHAIDKDRSVQWRDAASFVADVRALRAQIEADWRKVVTACVDAKLVSADAAKGLVPHIVLGEANLIDYRRDETVRLPDIR